MRFLLSTGKEKSSAENYIRAIERAGGQTTGGYCPAYSESADALLLCGGGDLCPSLYRQKAVSSGEPDTARDAAEWELLQRFAAEEKPVFGICRGLQTVNVFFGGTLYQDLGERGDRFHTQKDGMDRLHPVYAAPGSFLHTLYGETFFVNSAHHQAVDRLAPELTASAWSEGGVIEALSHIRLPIYCVQFHPERMCPPHRSGPLADGERLFRFFLSVCPKKETSPDAK